MSGDAKTRPDYNLQSNLRPEILLSSDDNDIDKVMSISVQHKVGAITIFAGAHRVGICVSGGVLCSGWPGKILTFIFRG